MLYNTFNGVLTYSNIFKGDAKVRKYRILQIILLFLFISVMSGACFKAPNKNTQPAVTVGADESNKTELRFICSWGGVDSKAETLKSVFNQFEKDNPDISISNESLFGEDFLPKIKTDFASGNDPDVFGLWPGSDINALVKAGKVADLTDILSNDQEWETSFDATMWNYTTHNGRIFGLPVEVIFECMFINRDLFHKYQVPVPQDFESLKSAVLSFRENKIVPIAFNTYSEGTYLYQNLIAMISGKEGTELPFGGGQVNPGHITAMQYIKELYDLGAFPEDCFTMTNNERNVLFKEKKAAMIVQGSWFIGDFDANDFSVDIIPIPHINGYKAPKGTMVYGLGGGSFHLSSAANGDPTKHSASIRLLKTLTSPNTAAIFAADTGMISNVNIDKYNIQYRSLTVKGKKMLAESKLLIGPADSFVDRTSWEVDIAQQFPYFLSGKISGEEVWARAVKNGIIPD